MLCRLQILRHAKSDWSQSLDDFERPLNRRGEEAISLMGKWLKENGDFPKTVYSSPAQRAKQTVWGIVSYINYSVDDINWESELYLASLEKLVSLLFEWLKPQETIMLVGHNPGLENLVHYLSGDAESDNREFPTAAFACFEIDLPNFVFDATFNRSDWSRILCSSGTLVAYNYPKNL